MNPCSTGGNDEKLPLGAGTFMIDTVSFHCSWPLRVEQDDYWRFKRFEKEKNLGQGSDVVITESGFSADHVILGIHIIGKYSRITHVRVSLPRMVHGDNSLLIVSQTHVDKAIEALINEIDTIADTSSGIAYYTRVDLVWQFTQSPTALIRAHRYAKFPRCRRSHVSHSDTSSSWDYEGKRIAIYDKKMKTNGLPGDVARVEVQLSKSPLVEYLSHNDEHLTQLRFDDCYRAYRSIMTTFAPSLTVDSPRDIYEALATLEEEATAERRQSPIELIISTMTPRTARDWRRKITAATLRRQEFQWENVLPETHPPEDISAW